MSGGDNNKIAMSVFHRAIQADCQAPHFCADILGAANYTQNHFRVSTRQVFRS